MSDNKERGLYGAMNLDYPLVLVEWLDSSQPLSSWRWLDDYDWSDIVDCKSVGWLIHDGDQVKAIAPNIGGAGDENPQVSGVIRIPARCIRRVVRVFPNEIISEEERKNIPIDEVRGILGGQSNEA